jgi:ABC-type transport system involved in multi-copper enzyme maturation permease subunit
MSAPHLLLLVQAECLKLLSRRSAQVGLLVAALIGLLMPMVLLGLGSLDATVQGAPLSESLAASGARAALWALKLRNFWLMQTFTLLLVAQSLAGEMQARTLREDLLRPVHRSAVLAAKLASVMLFVALTLLLQFVFSAGLGSLVLGADGPWREVTLGYIATGLADLSFAAVAFAVAAALRSVTGALVGTLLFIIFEKLLSWFLFIAGGLLKAMPEGFTELPPAVWALFDAQPVLPSAAWEVGNSLATGAEIVPSTWIALAIYTFGGWLIADRLFARAEVP